MADRTERTAVKKQTTEVQAASRVCWESLEEWARGKLQGWLQGLLEEEVTELLGRRKSERRAVCDASEGYRNGHGKERRLTFSCGTVTVRRPRVRGLEERFVCRGHSIPASRGVRVLGPASFPRADSSAPRARPEFHPPVLP